MSAQLPAAERVADVVRSAGVRASIIGGHVLGSQKRVVVLGRSFAIADAFAFEQIGSTSVLR